MGQVEEVRNTLSETTQAKFDAINGLQSND